MLSTNKYFVSLVSGLVFAFPILVLTLKQASGVIYLLLVMLGAYLVLIPNLNEPVLKAERLFLYTFVLFVVVAGISILAGDDLTTGYRWFGKFLRFIFIVSFYLLLRKVPITDSNFWTELALGSIFCGFVALIEIFIDHMLGWGGGHTGRASGVTHPIMFGDISLAMAVMAFAGLSYFRKLGSWGVAIPLIALVLGLTACFLSGSRGAWIALPALILFLIWSLRSTIPGKVLISGITILIITPLLLLMLPGAKVSDRVTQTFKHLDDYINSPTDSSIRSNPIGIRLEMWQASWTMFKTSPVLGVGWGNYRSRALELVNKGQRNRSIADYSHPHNEYLSTMANGGVVGLLFLLALFIIPFLLFYKAYKNESEPIRALGIAGMLLVIAFSHFAMTEGVFERNITINFYAFYSALIMSLIMKQKSHAIPASRFKMF